MLAHNRLMTKNKPKESLISIIDRVIALDKEMTEREQIRRFRSIRQQEKPKKKSEQLTMF